MTASESAEVEVEASTSTKFLANSCPTCSRQFKRKEHLTRHQRSHSSARPFSCPLCARVFGRQDSLGRHIATHSNLAPAARQATFIACDACYKSKVRCDSEPGLPCTRCMSSGHNCTISRTNDSIIASTESARRLSTDDVGLDPDLHTLLSPPGQGPVTAVSFDQSQSLTTEPWQLPGINDHVMTTWHGDEPSLQCDTLHGTFASQVPQQHVLSFDRQARKWLQDFCDDAQ